MSGFSAARRDAARNCTASSGKVAKSLTSCSSCAYGGIATFMPESAGFKSHRASGLNLSTCSNSARRAWNSALRRILSSAVSVKLDSWLRLYASRSSSIAISGGSAPASGSLVPSTPISNSPPSSRPFPLSRTTGPSGASEERASGIGPGLATSALAGLSGGIRPLGSTRLSDAACGLLASMPAPE